MKNPSTSAFHLALLLLFLSQTPAYSNHSGVELDDESGFNYIEGSGKGPEDWWHLNENWTTCKFGMEQSPINLTEAPVFLDPSLGPLQTFYVSNPAILQNRGHDIMLSWPDGGGSLHIDGIEYRLRQCHWHSPAEHAVNRPRRHDLEMHMVHQTDDNKVAVIGILYKIASTPDPFLSKLMKPLRYLAEGKVNNLAVGYVTPWKVNWHKSYYRYKGSLTTPPCTEGVVWTVLTELRSVSEEQVNLLREAVHDGMENNARPLQPINGRQVGLFLPWIHDEHPSS